MNQNTGRVVCTITRGMFDNEFAVAIELIDGSQASLFADKQLVTINGSPNSGHLKVNVIDPSEPASTILLPSEAMETGTRWAQVPRGNLELTHDTQQH
jgi:hypothetical protein